LDFNFFSIIFVIGIGEIGALAGQHTVDTGQFFWADAPTTIWDYTSAQPWLVNVLSSIPQKET
jgi:hypothetical protein